MDIRWIEKEILYQFLLAIFLIHEGKQSILYLIIYFLCFDLIILRLDLCIIFLKLYLDHSFLLSTSYLILLLWMSAFRRWKISLCRIDFRLQVGELFPHHLTIGIFKLNPNITILKIVNLLQINFKKRAILIFKSYLEIHVLNAFDH
jgi:hypothetical protein